MHCCVKSFLANMLVEGTIFLASILEEGIVSFYAISRKHCFSMENMY